MMTKQQWDAAMAAYNERVQALHAWGHVLPPEEYHREHNHLQGEYARLCAAADEINRAAQQQAYHQQQQAHTAAAENSPPSIPMSARAKTGLWGMGFLVSGVTLATAGLSIATPLAFIGLALLGVWGVMVWQGLGVARRKAAIAHARSQNNWELSAEARAKIEAENQERRDLQERQRVEREIAERQRAMEEQLRRESEARLIERQSQSKWR